MQPWVTHLEAVSADPPNAGTWLANQTGTTLPQDHVYVRSNFPTPPVPMDGWVIDVEMSERHELGLEALGAFPTASLSMVLECAGNGRTLMEPVPGGTPWTLGGASTTTFGGVWLRDVLRSFALPPDATEIVFTGADSGTVPEDGAVPYQFSIPVEEVLRDDLLLATTMAGEPLSHEHGAPIRLVVPGQYAMKSVKWLRRIHVVSEPFRGHFVRKYRYFGDATEPEGAAVGAIQIRSLIASPQAGAAVRSGSIRLAGSAWSNGHAIASVDVSCDGGESWVPADLGDQPSPFASVSWTASVAVEPPTAQLAVRATDETGAIQPLEPRWNSNGYGNNVVHRVAVDVI